MYGEFQRPHGIWQEQTSSVNLLNAASTKDQSCQGGRRVVSGLQDSPDCIADAYAIYQLHGRVPEH